VINWVIWRIAWQAIAWAIACQRGSMVRPSGAFAANAGWHINPGSWERIVSDRCLFGTDSRGEADANHETRGSEGNRKSPVACSLSLHVFLCRNVGSDNPVYWIPSPIAHLAQSEAGEIPRSAQPAPDGQAPDARMMPAASGPAAPPSS
jgi:hypothetical protein